MAKQGIEILLQTIIFTCMKQMEKYWDRVNWLVSTEKDLLCICWEARHISIPSPGESRRCVSYQNNVFLSLSDSTRAHSHCGGACSSSSPAQMLLRLSICTSPFPPAATAGRCMTCRAQLPPLPCPALFLVEHLKCSIRKALAAFLEKGTDPNIAKAKFPTLVASWRSI